MKQDHFYLGGFLVCMGIFLVIYSFKRWKRGDYYMDAGWQRRRSIFNFSFSGIIYGVICIIIGIYVFAKG